jgi:2-haloacid dehalogenase
VDYFLQHVCTPEWNAQQDAGRPIGIATEVLIKEFPEYESAIRAYYDQWTRMLGGPINPSVNLLQEVRDNGKVRLFALTNWSAETFSTAKELFPFLYWFEGIVVSGEEKMKKPDRRIYSVLLSRYDLEAAESVFIDDRIDNIQAAEELGFLAIHFKDSDQVRSILKSKGILY